MEDYANEVEKNIPIPVDENGYLDPLKTSLNGGTYHFNADRDYLSPIPTDEILKNPNLTQNLCQSVQAVMSFDTPSSILHKN